MKQKIIITPPKILSFNLKNLREIFKYRELFFILALRDIKIKYKQTILGIGWTVLQPLLLVTVFTFFFKHNIGQSVTSAPYSLFVLSGLVFWVLFSSLVSKMSDSLVSNRSLVEKIYMPRIIIPFSTLGLSAVDFFVMSLIFICFLFYFSISVTMLSVLLFIVALVITVLTATGLGLFLATLNVRFRDVKQIVPFLLQILLFMTPVIYPVSVLGDKSWLWTFNPLAGAITALRDSLFQISPVDYGQLIIALSISASWFMLGVIFFKINERFFADII